ncbi:MAG: hypothetical protein K0Q71_2179 [Thermomicrobiales bacterium]|nr:hypothetical protein [Thermomicrobiales bacterium]
MAMVFNRDVLFLHVPKTGGVSVTNYLLQVLPPPVYYVTKGPIKQAAVLEGVSFIAGEAHQTLETARKFLPAYGFELEQFPRILATLRNPYDLTVSYYTYKRSPQVEFTLVNVDRVPNPTAIQTRTTPGRSKLQEALAEALTKLQSDKVARFEPTGSETLVQLGKELHRVAVDRGTPVETWRHGGALYATLKIRSNRSFRNVYLSRHFDFPEFLQELTAGRHNHLSRMSKYYFLDALSTRDASGSSSRAITNGCSLAVRLLKNSNQSTRLWEARSVDGDGLCQGNVVLTFPEDDLKPTNIVEIGSSNG